MKLLFLLFLSGSFGIYQANAGTCIKGREQNHVLSDTTPVKITKTKFYEVNTFGISHKKIETYFDSGYYPRSLYFNIRFTEVLGITLTESTGGRLSVQLFDEKENGIPLPKEPRFYVAKTFKEGDQLNFLFSIPLLPTDGNNKKYTYKLTFDTNTGKKIMTINGKVRTQ